MHKLHYAKDRAHALEWRNSVSDPKRACRAVPCGRSHATLPDHLLTLHEPAPGRKPGYVGELRESFPLRVVPDKSVGALSSLQGGCILP